MRRLHLVALLALAGCASLDGDQVATFAGAALGAAAGSFTATVAVPAAQPAPAPVVVPAELAADGGYVAAWPDAGPEAPGCEAVADRVCCTPAAIHQLTARIRDGGT